MWWSALNTRFRDWVKRLLPYVQIGLYKTTRFTRSSRWFPGAVISIASALVIAFSIGWQALGPILDRPAWWMLAVAVVFYFIGIACRALILQTLMPEQVDFMQSLVNLNEGLLINTILPLRLGDNGRAFLLARKLEGSVFHIRSAIRVERLYDILIAASLIIFSLVIASATHGLKLLFFGMLILVVLLLFSLPIIARYKSQLRTLIEQSLEYYPWNSQKIKTKALSTIEGMTVLSDWSVFGTSLLWSGLAWVFQIGGLIILLEGVSPYAPLGYGVFAASMLALSGRIPSAPAAVGVYEGAIILALVFLGVDPTTALACALISHIIDIILPLFLGGTEFIREGETLPGLYKKLAGYY